MSDTPAVILGLSPAERALDEPKIKWVRSDRLSGSRRKVGDCWPCQGARGTCALVHTAVRQARLLTVRGHRC